MEKKSNAQKILAVLLIVCSLFLLALMIPKNNTPVLFLNLEKEDAFNKVMSSGLKGYKVERLTEDKSFISAAREGNLVVCYDVQAASAQKEGLDFNFYPKCAYTVIFAVDADKVDEIPLSWADLYNSKEKISWIYSSNLEKKLILASMAYGLTGDEMETDRVYTLLRKKYAAGIFDFNDKEAPIRIMFDSRVCKNSENIKLIIPKEGTYTYNIGILTKGSFDLYPEDEAFLSHGLRLCEGKSANSTPDYGEYKSAKRPSDAVKLLTVTDKVVPQTKRKVEHSHLYTSSGEFETIIMFLAMLIFMLIWMGSVYYRSARKDIQKLIMLLGIQIILWALLSMIKHLFNENSVYEKALWYLYYVFQMGLPLNLLWITLTQENPSGKITFPPVMKVSLFCGFALFIMVITNDFHNLVFRIQMIDGKWTGSYGYGPVYIMIYIYCFLMFFMAVASLVYKSIQEKTGVRILLPAAGAFMLVFYTISYALNLPIAHGSNYAYTFCILSVLFMESCLRSGLIPVNTGYKELFTHSPLALQLLNKKGESVVSGRKATMLPSSVIEKIKSQGDLTVQCADDVLLLAREVRGGTIVWEEDRKVLNNLRKEMDLSSKKLEKANLLLQKEEMVRKEKLSYESSSELFESLENEIYERTEELSEAIDDLLSSDKKEKKTAYITLLLCYIKRRCNLFFLAREDRDMLYDELSMYLDEMCEFARFASVSALFTINGKGSLDINEATLFYDFCFSLIAFSHKEDNFSMVGDLKHQDGKLIFRVLSSKELTRDSFTESFLKNVEDSGGTLSFKTLDEETGIYLVFEEGGKK